MKTFPKRAELRKEVREIDSRLDGEARRILYGTLITFGFTVFAYFRARGWITGELELSLQQVLSDVANLTLLLGLTYARSKVGRAVEVLKPWVEPLLPPEEKQSVDRDKPSDDEPIGALTDAGDTVGETGGAYGGIR